MNDAYCSDCGHLWRAHNRGVCRWGPVYATMCGKPLPPLCGCRNRQAAEATARRITG